jgi:hypothetical protein
MKVSIHADDGELLWSRQIRHGQALIVTSANYLRDGMQHKIIDALDSALREARGQLRCTFDVADAISDIGAPTAKIDRRIPISIVWNRDACRESFVEAAVGGMATTAAEAAEV